MDAALWTTAKVVIAASQGRNRRCARAKLVRPLRENSAMYEMTPHEMTPQETLPELPADIDMSDLDDPTAGVIAVELSRLVVRHCLRSAEPLVSDLAAKEGFLRGAGGPEVATRLFAMRLFQEIDAAVYYRLRSCVPREQIAAAQACTEDLLRAQLSAVVSTAVSHLLSDGRDVAIQMTAVAATAAGNEVLAAMPAIITQFRSAGEDC